MRELVESLAQEFDIIDVAAAAVAIANDGAEKAVRRRRARGRRIADRSSGRLTLLQISVGKEESIRPADLVGAIAGEAGVPSRVIGAIKIHDDYSLVEVPEELSERIIAALQAHQDPRQQGHGPIEAGAVTGDRGSGVGDRGSGSTITCRQRDVDPVSESSRLASCRPGRRVRPTAEPLMK